MISKISNLLSENRENIKDEEMRLKSILRTSLNANMLHKDEFNKLRNIKIGKINSIIEDKVNSKELTPDQGNSIKEEVSYSVPRYSEATQFTAKTKLRFTDKPKDFDINSIIQKTIETPIENCTWDDFDLFQSSGSQDEYASITIEIEAIVYFNLDTDSWMFETVWEIQFWDATGLFGEPNTPVAWQVWNVFDGGTCCARKDCASEFQYSDTEKELLTEIKKIYGNYIRM